MDEVDRISEGRTLNCPECEFTVSHMDAGVALQIMNNHVSRRHGNVEARLSGRS